MATQRPRADACTVLAEAHKIIKSHSRLFLALSVLFLVPLSFSITIFPTVPHSLIDQSLDDVKVVYLQCLSWLFYTFFYHSLFLCATATITYSVYHGFLGRPVKLASAIKSLTNSFPRLLITFLCAQVILSGIGIGFGLVVFLVIRGIGYLGFEIVYSSRFYSVISVISLVVLGFGFLYLLLNWALAPVVVVVESSWGLKPLRRSAYLVNGMRHVAFTFLFGFGGLSFFMVRINWDSAVGFTVLRALLFVVTNVSISLHTLAANTVLYMYCKALHGELAGEIAEEFAGEYVRLPFDEGKVPFVVSVVQP